MAWDLPANPVASTVATVVGWGQKVRDCLEYIKGLAGAVTIEDDLIVSGDVTVDNLITAGNVDGRDVSADGTTLDDHGHANHTNRTRAIPMTAFDTGTGLLSSVGRFPVTLLGNGQDCESKFQIPVGYVGSLVVKVGIIPQGTGTFDWTVQTEALDNGGVIGSDTDTDTANAQAGTNNTMLELDISAAFDGLTLIPGNWVGVYFTIDGVGAPLTGLRMVGLYPTYEADE